MGGAAAHGSGASAVPSASTKTARSEDGKPTHLETAVFANVSRYLLDSAQEQASLQLASRELSGEHLLMRDGSSSKHTPAAAPASPAQATSAQSTCTAMPRPDRTVSWADVDDSDSEEEVAFANFNSPSQALIPSFSGEASPGLEGAEGAFSAAEDSPSPLAPPVSPLPRSIISDEPVQTHFGFDLLSLGAVPEDAEVDSASGADDAADPNNRVSVLISGGAEDCSDGQPAAALPRQHGYAGVLTMLHRSVSADASELPLNSLAVTSARIEAVLPVGQDERVRKAASGPVQTPMVVSSPWLE